MRLKYQFASLEYSSKIASFVRIVVCMLRCVSLIVILVNQIAVTLASKTKCGRIDL